MSSITVLDHDGYVIMAETVPLDENGHANWQKNDIFMGHHNDAGMCNIKTHQLTVDTIFGVISNYRKSETRKILKENNWKVLADAGFPSDNGTCVVSPTSKY